MSEETKLPIMLKTDLKQSDLKRGDVFLWKSEKTGKFEIHTFKEDGGYGAQTFTEPYGEDGGMVIVNYSGICGLIVVEEVDEVKLTPMNLESKILVENGEMFDGTREQFMDCFFSNAYDEQIKDWCSENGWSLKIDGKIILE